jgi:hypothetical protein
MMLLLLLLLKENFHKCFFFKEFQPKHLIMSDMEDEIMLSSPLALHSDDTGFVWGV